MPRLIRMNSAARDLLTAGFREGQPLELIRKGMEVGVGVRLSIRTLTRWRRAWQRDQQAREESILAAIRTFVTSPTNGAMDALLERLLERQLAAFPRSGKRGVSNQHSQVSFQPAAARVENGKRL